MMKEFLVWYVLPLGLGLLFLIAYHWIRTKLITGLLLSGTVVSFFVILFIQAYESGGRVFRIMAVIPVLLAVLLLSFGVYIFIAFLIWNTRAILRKEKRDLKHLLALIFAVGLLLFLIIPRFIDLTGAPRTVAYLSYSVYGLMIYYLLHLTQYVISMILCNLSRVPKRLDYIMVLGSWIKDGKVTPILARRMDKAIKLYRKQEKAGTPPKLVLSGGKGPDEACSEAEAMKAYAVEKGIPEEHLLAETKSTSTLENMQFSKRVMDDDSGGKPYQCIYATNNYHVLRAGIFARKAGLNINGAGAKTAFYYLPNAVLREYIAYIWLHIKWNVGWGVCSLIFGSLLLPVLIDHLSAILSV